MGGEGARVLFGRRVRQLRKERGVSQEAFAHQVRIDRSYFGSIERGERNVSLDNICLIADGLGVPPHELLRFDALSDPDRPPAGAPAKRRPPRPQERSRRRHE
jgi:transcriptional regulator with XRE-family HTH domain